jgi:hypothetical protein
MKRLLVASFAATTFSAYAGTVGPPKGVVDVEYWGSIDSISFGEGLSIGEPMRGTFRIDPSLAPKDRAPSSHEGNYIWNAQCDFDCPPHFDGPSFVTNDRQRMRGISDDHGFVIDAFPASGGQWDTFGIENVEYLQNPNQTYQAYEFFDLTVFSPSNFIIGDDLAQRFDIRPAETGGHGFATIREFVGEVNRLFTLTIDRVRVTPRACRP